ncbi:MAG TPA: SEC-C domain-containing protein [Polyangiales bacterium]
MQLRRKLARTSTESVVGWMSAYAFVLTNDPDAKETLTSPSRQTAFALSLMLTTPQPSPANELDKAGWQECMGLLNQIFACYGRMYRRPDGSGSPSDEQNRTRLVAMSAFTHYFHTGIVATTHQVADRIRTYLGPHDATLKGLVGLTATKCLQICDHVADTGQAAMDKLRALEREERPLRLDILKRAKAEGWTIQQAREEAERNGLRAIAISMFELQAGLCRLRRSDLEAAFGEDGLVFWNRFTVERGTVPRIDYLTDKLVHDQRPLLVVSDGEAVYFTANALYGAVLDVLETALLDNEASRAAYLRQRDRRLEDEAAEDFQRLLPTGACYRGAFDSPHGQHEHDLVMLAQRTLFVVEMKASPPVEPLRDPDKAFQRVSQAFRSDRGPQKAYEQARRIWRLWNDGKPIELFDRHGASLARFERADVDDVFMVCVTRDEYGALACDLSLLLQKEPNEPYPWVLDVYALDSLVDGWRYFKWGLSQLVEFLRVRITLHGRVEGSDEMEYAGFYIKHGFRELLRAEYDHLMLNPNYSDVFQEIWMAEKYGAPPVVVKRTKPFLGDVRKMLSEREQEEAAARSRRQGVNERCACGSNKKFKHCHGRPRAR